MTNPKAPHGCAMHIILDIHELDKNGEFSGKVVGQSELEKLGLKSKYVLKITGENRDACLMKIRKMLNHE